MLNILSHGFTILLLVLPLVSTSWLSLRKEGGVLVWMMWTGVVAVGCYLALLASVQLTEVYLEAELNRFDLDGNGSFSGRKLTPEMEEAMRAVTSDTGRTFAPYTGLVACPIDSGLWHFLLGVPYIVISWARRGRMSSEQVGGSNHT